MRQFMKGLLLTAALLVAPAAMAEERYIPSHQEQIKSIGMMIDRSQKRQREMQGGALPAQLEQPAALVDEPPEHLVQEPVQAVTPEPTLAPPAPVAPTPQAQQPAQRSQVATAPFAPTKVQVPPTPQAHQQAPAPATPAPATQAPVAPVEPAPPQPSVETAAERAVLHQQHQAGEEPSLEQQLQHQPLMAHLTIEAWRQVHDRRATAGPSQKELGRTVAMASVGHEHSLFTPLQAIRIYGGPEAYRQAIRIFHEVDATDQESADEIIQEYVDVWMVRLTPHENSPA